MCSNSYQLVNITSTLDLPFIVESTLVITREPWNASNAFCDLMNDCTLQSSASPLFLCFWQFVLPFLTTLYCHCFFLFLFTCNCNQLLFELWNEL